MALHYELGKIANYEELCYQREPEGWNPPPMDNEWQQLDDGSWRRLSPVTKALVFMSMTVELGVLTERNIGEWWARMQVADFLYGVTLFEFKDGKRVDLPITIEELCAHIGLSTNATTVSRPQWLARVKRNMDQMVEFAQKKLEKLAEKESP